MRKITVVAIVMFASIASLNAACALAADLKLKCTGKITNEKLKKQREFDSSIDISFDTNSANIKLNYFPFMYFSEIDASKTEIVIGRGDKILSGLIDRTTGDITLILGMGDDVYAEGRCVPQASQF